MDWEKCYFHVDLDAFFASVEQLLHPEYRGKPVIISGDPHHKRNVVSTASYEARKFGVHSAMPSFKAYELCPHGIFVEPHMDDYYEYSQKVMEILQDFSPDFLQLSVDEACLDMTGTRRLFGEPLQAAEKIKQRIKDETGLTISIGIASNSYLAKICSEVKKPDGLFQVLPGDEEKFVSTLPLKKLWGVGEKTLSRLNSCGFHTVNDIKSHSRNFLKSIVGDAGSSFLYNVCRGLEPENFRSEPKSHSASIESTFEFDLTEINTIETTLLDLCSQMMHRLLVSNTTSMTVHLKIRYEDFTTVSIQQTYETPVLCTDDLYSRILSLFNRKYESGRGIRLLGVGVQKSIPVSAVIQPELFESENKKKQAVEKAILQLETKHPEIKVSKARLMTKIKSLISVLVLSIFINQNSSAQTGISEIRPDIKDTSPTGAAAITDDSKLPPKKNGGRTKLFDLDFGEYDQNSIEFYADGFWNLKLSETFNATFGYGHDFTPSFSTPVFEQDVDLSLWFMLNKHYYLQGTFADQFNKNLFALGYQGTDTVKEIKIANRNVIFPDYYSLSDISRSIGGGDNQAPGISASFSNDKWKADAVIRYDMLQSFDKTFYGKNAVTNLKIPQTNYMTGLIYIMPSSGIIENLSAVYIESTDGTYFDDAGRSYKKVSHNNYLILSTQNKLVLSPDVAANKRNSITPCLLFEFNQDAKTLITPSLGKYGTVSTPGSGYLGSIQKFFSLNNKNINVSDYSYSGKLNNISVPDKTGNSTDGYFVSMNGKTLLLAQHSSGFSPFMAAYRYDGGASAINEVQVASRTTETKSAIYTAFLTDSMDIVRADFFNTRHTFADVYNPEYTLSSRGTDGNAITYSSPEINFPFADRNPGTYLGFGQSTDDCIMFRSFSQTNRLEIGTKAVPGTVTVYKNGILDSSAKYNFQTGEVTLSSGVSDSDKIYITWFEDSSEFQSGMISGAVGFTYDISDKMHFDTAISSRWALNPELTYAEYKKIADGYASIAAGFDFSDEKIKIKNISGFTFQVDNITSNYRVSGMDNAKPSTAYLISDASRNLPVDFSPVINPRPSENTARMDLPYKNNCSVEKQTGIQDEKISGYAIPVSYNFNRNTDSPDEVLWASNTIITSASKNLLSNTSKYNFAIKLSDEFISLANDASTTTRIYIQLGVDSDENLINEDRGFIPTWKIFDSKNPSECIDLESKAELTNQWQTVSLILQDQDRSFFSDNYNVRLIITASKKPDNYRTGSIYIGPYEAVTQGIFVHSENSITTSTEQLKQNYSAVKKFNKDDNYVQYINWNIQNKETVSNSKITAYKYFDEADFSSYRKISLYFTIAVNEKDSLPAILTEDETAFSLVLDRDSDAISSNGQKALELKIKSDDLRKYIEESSLPGSKLTSMHKLEIDRISRKVYIDDNQINYKELYINPNVVPSRVKIDVNAVTKTSTESDAKLYKQGSFGIDEFYYSDNSSKMILQNLTKVNLNHKGPVLSTKNNFALISDPSISASGEIYSTFYTSPDFENKTGFSGNADAEVTLAGIKITTDAGRSSDSKHIISTAGHSIKNLSPLFNVLSFSEDYALNKDYGSINKTDSAELNFNALNVPLTLKAETRIESDSWSSTQEVNDSLSFTTGSAVRYALNITAKASQKIKSNTSDFSLLCNDDYFSTWLNASQFQFSPGSNDASRRIIGGEINNTFTLPFASFTPQINFEETASYTSDSQNMFTDTTGFTMSFPFKIQRQNFTISYTKSGTLVKNTDKGGNYGTDFENLCHSLSKKDWYFYSGPFYDLFSQDLAKKVLNTIPDAKKQSELLYDEKGQSVNYNAQYNFTWKRPLFADKKDIFIPNIATLSLARDISTAENIADTYQIKATAGYTAINVFSKNGSYPLFKWCESDEYNMSLQAVLKIPREEIESIKNVYNIFIQANFYKTLEDVIRTGIQFSFQDIKNWSAKASFVYKRQSHFTPLLEVVKLFDRNYDYSNVKISRTDSFDINLYSSLADSANASLRQYQSFDMSHKLEFQIMKQFALSTNIDAHFSHTRDEIFTLGFTAGIGGSFNF